MILYIEVTLNGKTVNHPIEENNLMAHLDVETPDQIPSNKYEPFDRVEPPHIQWYENYVTTYQKKTDGRWTDVFYIYEMPREQRIEVLNAVGKAYPSWVMKEDATSWVAPSPYPEDGKQYMWNEQTLKWEIADFQTLV